MEIKNRSNGNSDWRSQQACFGTLPAMPPLVPRNDARAVHMAPAEGGRGFSLGEPVIRSDGQAMRDARSNPLATRRETMRRSDEAM